VQTQPFLVMRHVNGWVQPKQNEGEAAETWKSQNDVHTLDLREGGP